MNLSRDRDPSLVASILLCALALAWTGCGNDDEKSSQDTVTDEADGATDGSAADAESSDAPADVVIAVDAGPLEKVYAFAVIADPHVTGKTKNHDRLVAAVAWINDHAKERNIELVLVLGDIAWGKGMTIAREDLDQLKVPWVPIIGDNEIAGGSEQDYDKVFGSRYDAVAKELDDVVRAPLPVTATDGSQLWLQNLAFSHRGMRFIGLDFNARVKHFIRSEQGHLHDVPGGTWSFFENEINNLGERKHESVVMYSHIPMHLSPGGFDSEEMDKITALVGPKGDLIYAQLSGHYHFEMIDEPKDAGFTMFCTDATWDDEVRVRVIDVSANGERFDFAHELVAVPWSGP